MHGHGWQVSWRVVERRRRGLHPVVSHAPARDWPWGYEGRQTLSIHDNELRMTLAIENLGSTRCLAGWGFIRFCPPLTARD